ncbi:MAG: methionyl-tRNA formyltransferase [Bryobacterales bacterium]|nr:methionyl-tRNA formyltransferase [Bryobacterales bacterium]
MNIVYMGTPQFAVPTLEAILAEGHNVTAVFTQPDRPKGRGRQLASSPVKQCALSRGLAIEQPERIRRPESHAKLQALHPDCIVVVGYGQIIPQTIIDIPRFGIVNVHASLLPKYRGAAPIQWAIAGGESVTGVATMQIDAGLDTGDILLMRETTIGPEENAVELSERLSHMGAGLLVETLRGLASHTIASRKQDNALASYAPILKKEDGVIDWNWTAARIHCRIRGFHPWPGCFTVFRGQRLHIWKARLGGTATQPAGRIYARNSCLFASCGEGSELELLELQLEGRKKTESAPFLNGHRLLEYEELGGEINR